MRRMTAMTESVKYEFYASTRYANSGVSQVIDLVAEGYVGSVEEWNLMKHWEQTRILEDCFQRFMDDEIDRGWIEVES